MPLAALQDQLTASNFVIQGISLSLYGSFKLPITVLSGYFPLSDFQFVTESSYLSVQWVSRIILLLSFPFTNSHVPIVELFFNFPFAVFLWFTTTLSCFEIVAHFDLWCFQFPHTCTLNQCFFISPLPTISTAACLLPDIGPTTFLFPPAHWLWTLRPIFQDFRWWFDTCADPLSVSASTLLFLESACLCLPLFALSKSYFLGSLFPKLNFHTLPSYSLQPSFSWASGFTALLILWFASKQLFGLGMHSQPRTTPLRKPETITLLFTGFLFWLLALRFFSGPLSFPNL